MINFYLNSGQLARACPPIRCSHPLAMDNTERFNYDAQTVLEPAKSVLCYDCQKPIAPGMGVQMTRNFNGGPLRSATLVHPECERVAAYWNPRAEESIDNVLG